MINELAKEIHKNAVDKGFYEGEKNIGEMLCLIHSEVSEALEADREGNHVPSVFCDSINNLEDFMFKQYFESEVKNTFEDELADIVIRVLDLAGFKQIDLESHIKAKMRYNSMREHKHGKKY